MRGLDVLVWRYERLSMDDFMRGRDRLEKYQEEAIRQDVEEDAH